MDKHVSPLDDEHSRLVHLTAALVGSPDSRVVYRNGRNFCRQERRRSARKSKRSRIQWPAYARSRCARYLVLVVALAVRDFRLAGGYPRFAGILSDDAARHRIRDYLFLGRADD